MKPFENTRPAVAAYSLWLKPDGEKAGLVAMIDKKGAVFTRDIDRVDQRILELANAERSGGEVALELGLDSKEANARFEGLEGFLHWIHRDTAAENQNRRLVAAALELKFQWNAASAIAGKNAEFHARGIKDAHRQFNEVETTVSHLFRESHMALAERTYGEAFCDWLLDSGALKQGARIIEVGCGVGFFANHLLSRLKDRESEIYNSIRYTMFDLSPELQASQQLQCAKHTPRITFEQGNIEEHDFGDHQFDLVIANEMLADLNVEGVSPGNIQAKKPKTVAEKMAIRFDLEFEVQVGNRTGTAINSGAIRMLEKLEELLARDGRFFLSEYGSNTEPPKAVAFEDHVEYSIHFGHLSRVAEKLGLHPQLENLGELLDFDGDFQMLNLLSFETLNQALLPALGLERIPKLPYDRDSLNAQLSGLAENIGNLVFEPLVTTKSLSPFRFLALTGRK